MITEKYNVIKSFETYRNKSDASIFLDRIWKMIPQNKETRINLSDDIPAYRLLKTANLAVSDEVKTMSRELS